MRFEGRCEKKKEGILITSVGFVVLGTYWRIARIKTPRTVISVCETSMASLLIKESIDRSIQKKKKSLRFLIINPDKNN